VTSVTRADTPRVGVLYPVRNPAGPEHWSGSPAGIVAGLRAQGVDAVPIGTPSGVGPDRVRLLWRRLQDGPGSVADHGPAALRTRTAVLRRAVARAGRLDALVAMGTDLYELGAVRPADVPVATFDDGTLRQQWANASSDIRGAGFAQSDVTTWFEVQAASSRAADAVCVSTSWARRSFEDEYGVPRANVHVVGMGHRPRGAPAPGERDWRVPHYLFVGVDWRRKNGDAVVRAFERVRRETPRATLDVVGGHPPLDAPGVRGHGLLRREDAAAQRRLDGLFAHATAFVMPSRFDPSPIAYLEAASAGIPVVATTEGGAGELLGPAALSVHPDDADALVDAMRRLADPVTAASLGADALARSADASWPRVAGRILAAVGLADVPASEPAAARSEEARP
jgi:hypothetical protein